MATILITGASGQLGHEIIAWHEARRGTGYRLVATDVAELDITDSPAVDGIVLNEKVDVIVNCAAYTAVDRAESEPELAKMINALGPKVLAHSAAKYNAKLIQISTDYVFDGSKSTPYAETDPTSPLGVYGRTKLDGEQAVIASGCGGIIVRTAWLYSAHGHNFVKTMMRLGAERESVTVVDDQWGSPTWAGDLADFIMGAAIPKLLADPQSGGIYNYSNMGRTSWHGFAKRIMELAGLPCRVEPVSTSGYPTPARRPQYSLLDKTKVIEDFDIKISAWEESLAKCIKQIQAK